MGNMKRLLIILGLMMLSFTLIGCGSGDKVPSAQKTITIGLMPDVESIPFVMAEKNGYFAQENVTVKLEYFKSAKDRDSALQSGQLDGVVTDLLAVVFANEGGFNLKALAKSEGDIKLLAGKNSGIDTMDKLKGSSIGLSTNTIMEYSLDKMLETSNITLDQVKKVAIPQLPTRLEMLNGEKIEAAILPEPLASLAIKDGAKVLLSTDQMGGKAGALAFTGKALEEKGTEVTAVFKAYNMAANYLNEEIKPEDLDYLIDKLGFPLAVRETITLPIYNVATTPDNIVVEELLDWVTAKELIKSTYKYEDLVEGDFLIGNIK